jgi:hypothetical protein
VGADLGQQRDASALILVGTDEHGHHDVGYVARLPLHTPYQGVVDAIVELADAASEYGPVTIVADHAGVGRPVLERLRDSTGHPVVAVTATGGYTVSATGADLRVPKGDIVDAAVVCFEDRRVHLATDGPKAEALVDELRRFSRDTTAAGHLVYEGPGGHRDDLVSALCLALWHAERRAVAGARVHFHGEHDNWGEVSA